MCNDPPPLNEPAHLHTCDPKNHSFMILRKFFFKNSQNICGTFEKRTYLSNLDENKPLTMNFGQVFPMLTTHNEIRASILAQIFSSKYLGKSKTNKKTISPRNINTVDQLECKQSLCNCTEKVELEQKQGGAILLGVLGYFWGHAAVLNLAVSSFKKPALHLPSPHGVSRV